MRRPGHFAVATRQTGSTSSKGVVSRLGVHRTCREADRSVMAVMQPTSVGLSVSACTLQRVSMIGEYFRLTPEDFARALSEPEWARDLIDELWDAEDVEGGSDPRLLDVDKAWHGLALVLDRAGVSTAVVFGDDQVPGADDWGYGPPSSLSPERVVELAEALSSLNRQVAVDSVPAEEFVEAEVYPQGLWNTPESREYLAGHLERLTTYFVDTADTHMGILVWID